MIPSLLLLFTLAATAFSAELSLSVSHHYAGKPVFLDSFRYQTAQQETYALTRISYLLSGFQLEKTDGSRLELPDQYAWIDHQANTHFRLKNIPEADYKAIHFNVGLDKNSNHLDPAKYPADHPLSSLRNLHWNWAEGYIFLAIEGHQLEGKKGFVYHLANDHNLTPVSISQSIKITNNTHIDLNLDIENLINSPSPIHFLTDGNISHSAKDDPIAAKLKRNLTNSFSITKISSLQQPVKEKLKALYMPETFTPYPFSLPSHIPIPALPTDNPLISERVTLGNALFHDNRLSKDNSISCASCHQQQFAFTDPKKQSTGVNQATSLRNSMPLQNLAWKKQFFWDGRVSKLRDQVIFPITDKAEMHQDIDLLPEKINSLSPLFKKAFGNQEITTEKITLALEAYLLTLTSLDSKFDQSIKGNTTLTKQEQRGLKLFFTENDPRNRKRGADCFHCHSGPFFSDDSFHDTGLPSITDTGLERTTGKATDRFKFITPSLRNIALTAPYMHDGRFDTLEKVIDHYDHAHKTTPNLDPNLSKHGTLGLQLSQDDKAALVAFLKTLTDPKFK